MGDVALVICFFLFGYEGIEGVVDDLGECPLGGFGFVKLFRLAVLGWGGGWLFHNAVNGANEGELWGFANRLQPVLDTDAFRDAGADTGVVIVDWDFGRFVEGFTDCDAFSGSFFGLWDFLVEFGADLEWRKVVAVFLTATVWHERYVGCHFAHVGKYFLE